MVPLFKLVLAAAAGLLSHTTIFIHGEWHMQAPLLLRVYIGLAIATCIVESVSDSETPIKGVGRGFIIIIVYVTSLLTSLTLYRALFHRLSKFPGPSWAGISKFWHVARCIQTGSQNHLILDELHQRYGDFVRTGKLGNLSHVLNLSRLAKQLKLFIDRAKRAHDISP